MTLHLLNANLKGAHFYANLLTDLSTAWPIGLSQHPYQKMIGWNETVAFSFFLLRVVAVGYEQPWLGCNTGLQE